MVGRGVPGTLFKRVNEERNRWGEGGKLNMELTSRNLRGGARMYLVKLRWEKAQRETKND